MRDIAKAVGKQPVQVYRLKLNKADILAELIIALNDEQITLIPRIRRQVKGTTAFEKTCDYLRRLYQFDIEYLSLRSVGAAFGWLWSADYEQRVIAQVGELVAPIVQWMQDAEMDDMHSRILGVWSLYYVGYRLAVIRGESAEGCLAAIQPSLRYYFPPQDGFRSQR